MSAVYLKSSRMCHQQCVGKGCYIHVIAVNPILPQSTKGCEGTVGATDVCAAGLVRTHL